MPGLEANFARASPRLHPPPTPAVSLAIHAAVLALWLALLARACVLHGLAAWSIGIVYVAYDTLLLAFTAIAASTILRPAPPAAAPAAARPTLAVIVAAYNEAASLPATLAALAAQTDPPDVILVADDGSTDTTAAALASLPVRHLALPHGGKARALNAALAETTADLVVTVDADTILEPSALAAMRAAFAADPRLVAATGVLTPVCGPGRAAQAFAWFQTYEYVRNFLSRFAWMRAGGLLLISGAFAGFRREPLVAVGGFDPESLVEDYELVHRLRRANPAARTAVLGAARATTDAPATLTAFLRQRRRWFGGFLQTHYWYRDMVGNRTYGALGLAMLPIKAADTLQPLYGLAAFGLLVCYLGCGRFDILLPAGAVMAGKIAIDLAFFLYAVRLYARWTATRLSPGQAFAAALIEPFSFQVLRHAGAAWGWAMFLRGGRGWGAPGRLRRPGALPLDPTRGEAAPGPGAP